MFLFFYSCNIIIISFYLWCWVLLKFLSTQVFSVYALVRWFLHVGHSPDNHKGMAKVFGLPSVWKWTTCIATAYHHSDGYVGQRNRCIMPPCAGSHFFLPQLDGWDGKQKPIIIQFAQRCVLVANLPLDQKNKRSQLEIFSIHSSSSSRMLAEQLSEPNLDVSCPA